MTRGNIGLLVAASAAVGIYLFYRHAGKALIGATGTKPSHFAPNPMKPGQDGSRPDEMMNPYRQRPTYRDVQITNPLLVAAQARQQSLSRVQWEPWGTAGYYPMLSSGVVAPNQTITVRMQVSGPIPV